LLPDDASSYLGEIRRVLRNDGRYLSRWFIYDDMTGPPAEGLKKFVSSVVAKLR
jgi:hypothetical protein